jgi:iron(III) transport system permease protein
MYWVGVEVTSSMQKTRVAPPGLRIFRSLSADAIIGVVLLCLIGMLTVAPVIYAILSSFNVASYSEPYRFGLDGWRDVFSSPKTMSAIAYSFLLSIRIPIAIVFAFLMAWMLVRVRIPGRRLIEHALWFGYFLPALPITMGWILLLDQNYGLLNQLAEMLPFIHGPIFSIYSIPGILWVHLTLSTIPVMVILLAPALRQLDSASEEAADMAGARVHTTLWRITIPLIAPALLTAAVAGFIRSLEVFEVEQVLGTPSNIFVYATRIYDLISWEPPQINQAMALSALFLGLLLIVAMTYQYMLRRISKGVSQSAKGMRLQPRLRNWTAYAGTGVLSLYIVIGILLPLTMLILGSFSKLYGFFSIKDAWTLEHWREVLTDHNFLQASFNSITLGLLAAGLGTFLYALVAWVLVRRRVFGAQVISLFTWLPWAVPGLVLGIALLSLMLSTPTLAALQGTIIPLLIALLIKDMPLGVQMIRSALFQVPPDMEESAAIAGARFPRVFFKIVLPMIAPMLLAVFLLIFVATLRDISTIVLLAGPGTRTLSLLMFEFAQSGRFESAAVIGVIVAMLSLAIIAIAFKFNLKFGTGE